MSREIFISEAKDRYSKKWDNRKLSFSDLADKLSEPVRGLETLTEYLRLPKAEQDNLKDVGGFVGGYLEGGKRSTGSVKSRDLVTLDLDNIANGETQVIVDKVKSLGVSFVIYSTRKHEPSRPRLRVIIPLDRSVTPDEYEPIARKVGELINLHACDPTTFQASRLMYYPSASKDAEYVFEAELQAGELRCDDVLKMYTDWKDIGTWPRLPSEQNRHQSELSKQQDPRTKKGIIGAFCKTYNVYDVIDKYLPGVYTTTNNPDRLTHEGGSTFGGAIIYQDGDFIFSHHATDPISGMLCNSFDLVRIHKFSKLDENSKQGTPTHKLPSYKAMKELASEDDEVTSLLLKERQEEANADFNTADSSIGTDWIKLLKIDSNSGLPMSTRNNVLIILENDPLLKNNLFADEFGNVVGVKNKMPWNTKPSKRVWDDSDDSGLRVYLEKVYGIEGKEKIHDALSKYFKAIETHSVKDYLHGLVWDGVSRLDTLFIDYLGAEDTVYVREATRKAFTAAVTRVEKPGTKFDVMTILCGPQGIGKSTILNRMGRDWFTDSLVSFEGKDSIELLQGNWIIEVGELNGMSRSEVNHIKQFLSCEVDKFRAAYGRRTQAVPRQCVFFGTTNDVTFLRDQTGARRFWPIDVGEFQPKYSVFKDLTDEVIDQIWAEAYVNWQMGEKLILSKEANILAVEEQKSHQDEFIYASEIDSFLEQKVPIDWDKWSVDDRLNYWNYGYKDYKGELVKRDRICVKEIWIEAIKEPTKNLNRFISNQIIAYLCTKSGLKKIKSNARMGPYGRQKGFIIMSPK